MTPWIDAHWPYVEAAIGIGSFVAAGAILGVIVTWLRSDHA